ncbi:UNVERIFIED_CONTAM: hypothetical protein Slati_2435000 [Sesamum latifolium]|uniref:Uncharacterized protein n=1 Tax=Sesamum latifolium TaxID=2727402 RepID=A0AAW2WDY4_9LAMI
MGAKKRVIGGIEHLGHGCRRSVVRWSARQEGRQTRGGAAEVRGGGARGAGRSAGAAQNAGRRRSAAVALGLFMLLGPGFTWVVCTFSPPHSKEEGVLQLLLRLGDSLYLRGPSSFFLDESVVPGERIRSGPF